MKYIIAVVLCFVCLLTVGCSSGGQSATPTPRLFNLEVTSSDGGSAHYEGEISNLFIFAMVRVHAVPDSGYVFDKWTYCNGYDATNVDNDESATATVSIVDDDVCIKANFVLE